MADTAATAPHSNLAIRSLEPVARNSYRLLGLPGRASQSAIHDAAAATRRALKLGIRRSTLWDLPFLDDVALSEGNIQGAVGKLTNPNDRLRERLFWFYNPEEVLRDLSLSSLDETAEQLLDASEPTARHDAALCMLVAAVVFDPQLLEQNRWVRSFELWWEIIESDDYWAALLDAEIEGDFEPFATLAEVEELREQTPRLLADILAITAKDAVARDARATCQRALQVLADTGFPQSVLSEVQEEVLGPVEDAFEALCTEVRRECGENVKQDDRSVAANRVVCQRAVARFYAEIVPGLKRIIELAGRDSDYTFRAQEAASECLYGLAINHPWADEFVTAEELLQKAKMFAPPNSIVAGRIEMQLDRIAPHARQQRLATSQKQVEAFPPSQQANEEKQQAREERAQPQQESRQAPRQEPSSEQTMESGPDRSNLTPVKRAPPLFSLLGFGFRLFGQTNKDPKTGSYLSTCYLTALFLPLLPICRYLVIDAGAGKYRFLGKGPLRTLERLYLLLVLSIAVILGGAGLVVVPGLVRAPGGGGGPIVVAPTNAVSPTATLPATQTVLPTRTVQPTRAPTATPPIRGEAYIVQRGDTLGILSKRFDVPMAAILGANEQIEDPDVLHVGQELMIPQSLPDIRAAAESYLERAEEELRMLEAMLQSKNLDERERVSTDYERLRKLVKGIRDQYEKFLNERGG